MWARLAACLVVTGLSFSPALAQRTPGVQDAPPLGPTSLELSQATDGRRAVRGCPVGQDCTPAHQQLRMIELELFPERGGPWRSSDDLGPAPRQEQKIARKPSELRADLAWLDDVELPDLPVRWTPRLVEYLQFYKSDPRGRNIMRGWLTAAGRYRGLIVSKLAAAHLPLDLFYVAMIESSFEPGESSSAGAAGLWQFMPAGGRIYGLAQTHWVDERRDPLRATVAVVDYWKDLYQRFGDWHLAMAAFNAGYGAVLRSIARYNTNDYWQLCQYENALAWETSLYVPKALAVAIVGHNLELFGFADVKPDAPESWEEVSVPGALSLGVIARAAGATAERIKRLNPQLRKSRTPPDAKSYVVRVPTGAGTSFARRLAELQSEWDGYDSYVVAYGERFEDVAATFGISKRRLRELNELTDDSEVGGGSVLVVPRVAAEQRAKNRAAARQALHESGVDQQPGEPLVVALPDKDFALPGKRRVLYRAIIGDTLPAVARAFGVRTAELARWNGLAEDASLHPRMVLAVYVPTAFDAERKRVTLLDEDKVVVVTRGSPEHLDVIEQRVGRARVRYVAKRNESFESIAKKYGLKAADLARVNHLSPRTVLEPGQEIVVYQVVDHKRSERAAEQWKKMPKARRGKASGDKARGVTGRVGRDAEEVEVSDDDVTGEEQSDERGAERSPDRTRERAAGRDGSGDDAGDDAGGGDSRSAGARAKATSAAPNKTSDKAQGQAGNQAASNDAGVDKAQGKAADNDAKADKAQGKAADSDAKADKAQGKAADSDAKADKAQGKAERAKAASASAPSGGAAAPAAPVTSPAQVR